MYHKRDHTPGVRTGVCFVMECIFGPLRPSDLLARGFTAARWTSGRSARPPSLS